MRFKDKLMLELYTIFVMIFHFSIQKVKESFTTQCKVTGNYEEWSLLRVQEASNFHLLNPSSKNTLYLWKNISEIL